MISPKSCLVVKRWVYWCNSKAAVSLRSLLSMSDNPHLPAALLKKSFPPAVVFFFFFCFYNLGEGPCESCSPLHFLNLMGFLSFLSPLRLPSPSRRECFHLEVIATRQPTSSWDRSGWLLSYIYAWALSPCAGNSQSVSAAWRVRKLQSTLQ